MDHIPSSRHRAKSSNSFVSSHSRVSYAFIGERLTNQVKSTNNFRPEVFWGIKAPQTLELSLQLGEEYRLYQNKVKPPEGLQDWLNRYPQAWAETGGVEMAKLVPPVVIELKSRATPIGVRQYPMSREAQEGIRPQINKLLQQGILVPCKSPWNTPLLPVKKTRDQGLPSSTRP